MARKLVKFKKPTAKSSPNLLTWCFTPPYAGLPWLILLYVFIAIFANASGGVFTGHLFGFDDHVRMVQALDWINGAGWYDRTIERVNPPNGYTTIWSRIVDIPLAFTVLIFQQFMEQKTAVLVTAVVVPFVQLVILFYVARYFARPIAGKKFAWLIVLFLMFTSVLNFKQYTFSGFYAGEASHHSWYIILNLLLLGSMARVAVGVGGLAPIKTMAVAIALFLAVGIEGYPLIAGAAVILAIIAWWFQSPTIAKRGAEAFGGGALLTLLLLPMHQPFSKLLNVSFAEPSVLGPVLIGTAALFLVIEQVVISRCGDKRKITFVLLGVLTAAMAGLLILAFPQILDGPGAALSVAEREMAFREHPEAWPLYQVAFGVIDLIGFVMPTLLALIAATIAVRTSRSRRQRIVYVAYLGSTLLCGAMAEVLWRYYHHAMTTSCVWLLWIWQRIKESLPRNRHYSLTALIAFILLGPFWMVLLPAFQNNVPVYSQLLFFPSKLQAYPESCDPIPVSNYINRYYPKDTLLNVVDSDSAKFLYHTHVNIDFLANYPSQDRFLDNKAFFMTQNTDDARAIAIRHKIDLVAVCRTPLYIDTSRRLDEQIFTGLLQVGQVPDWLRQVDTGAAGNYFLYEVDKKELMKRKKEK